MVVDEVMKTKTLTCIVMVLIYVSTFVQAIIYTMLDNKGLAKQYWGEFIRTVDGGIPNPDSPS